MGIFSVLETILASKLNTLLVTYTASFASKMVLLIQGGITIMVLYYGYSIMTSRGSNATVGEMFWNMARIGIVLAFMQNASTMLDLSIAFIDELKTGFVGAKSVFSLLDTIVAAAQTLSEKVRNLDQSTFKLEGTIASGAVWIGLGFVLATAAIVFISAEVGLTLLTATAPIFIGCLTYSFLKEMFNGWLRSIFSCIITLIFASLIMRMGIDIVIPNRP